MWEKQKVAFSLSGLLSSLSWNDLKIMLKLANFPGDVESVNARAKGAQWIEEDAFGKNLQNTWDLLLPLEKLAVAEAIYNNDGHIVPDQMKNKYGKELILIKSNLPAQDRNKPEKAPRIKLFLYRHDAIPEDLAKRLKTFVQRPKPGPLSTQKEASAQNPKIEGQKGILQTFTAQKLALCDLISILTFIKKETLPMGASELPTMALTQKITKMLSAPDYFTESTIKHPKQQKSVRGFAWIILLKAADLICYRNETIELTKEGENVLGAPQSAKTVKKIFESFLQKSIFDEVFRIDTLANAKKGSYGKKTEFANPKKRRRIIIEMLQTCPNNTWILMTEFLRYLRAERPCFRVADRLGELCLGTKEMELRHFDHWFQLEGTYVKCLLMEYLATLGIIEINYSYPVFCENESNHYYPCDFISTYDGLYEFKITELGAYCLGMTQEEPQIEAASLSDKLFHVMPNLEITSVVDQMLKSDILMLDQCCDKINVKTWRLSASKLLTKLLNTAGQETDFLFAFKAFLYDKSLSAIPKTVEHFFEDMQRRVDQVTYEEEAIAYICHDKELAKMIAHDAQTKPFCFLTGESQLVVPVKTHAQFKTGLRQVGYIIQSQEEKVAS